MITRPHGGRADKRRSIVAGAVTVFARDGYTRASIDAIATEAGVSTRTIYNHFRDKTELFQSVIQDSAARAADAQIEIIGRYLRKVTDLEADLIEFGIALATPMPEYVDHFALVRQINAEAGHIPPDVIEAWQEVGPLRVRRELAGRLADLAERGMLRADRPDVAALHLMLLIAGGIPTHRPSTQSEKEITETVTGGVRAFLYGYQR